MQPPTDFVWVRDRHATFLVHREVAAWLPRVLSAARFEFAGCDARALPGGRGGTTLVRAAGQDVVVRAYRRGGLPGRLLHDTYCGWEPRPFRELAVTEVLCRRGAPVAAVVGAAVLWLAPGCYRGWLATRYLPGARTLWEWARAGADETRAGVLGAVGRAVRQVHASGGQHRDLNLNNILVRLCKGRDPEVVIIDFDRARLGVPSERMVAATFARLARSARKLDPAGRYFTASDLDRVRAAYFEALQCA